MQILLAGVNHKTDTLQARERLAAVGAEEAFRALRAEGWGEAVVVSTCNRFEVYAARPDGADAAGLAGLLERWAGSPLAEHIYRKSGGAAVSHLFSVAGGLDSLVVGEAEVLGQVKQAYEAALAAAMTGKLTNVLFQRALYVGKLVRSQTGIACGQMSVPSVAVALAERIFGSLSESSVLILGAGQMAELAARHLLSGKVARLFIANRTWARAVELAGRFEAEAVRWEDFPPLLERVDIVIGSTGAPQPVVTSGLVSAAARTRKGRSLFLIDIALPRDIEESVNDLDHVYLYTLEHLQGIVAENLSRRQAEVSAARNLVAQKSAEFEAWLAGVAGGVRAGLTHSSRNAPPINRPDSLQDRRGAGKT